MHNRHCYGNAMHFYKKNDNTYNVWLINVFKHVMNVFIDYYTSRFTSVVMTYLCRCCEHCLLSVTKNK